MKFARNVPLRYGMISYWGGSKSTRAFEYIFKQFDKIELSWASTSKNMTNDIGILGKQENDRIYHLHYLYPPVS